MRKSRFTEEQIIGFLKQAEAGRPVAELCRQVGITDTTFYKVCAGSSGGRAGVDDEHSAVRVHIWVHWGLEIQVALHEFF